MNTSIPTINRYIRVEKAIKEEVRRLEERAREEEKQKNNK